MFNVKVCPRSGEAKDIYSALEITVSNRYYVLVTSYSRIVAKQVARTRVS